MSSDQATNDHFANIQAGPNAFEKVYYGKGKEGFEERYDRRWRDIVEKHFPLVDELDLNDLEGGVSDRFLDDPRMGFDLYGDNVEAYIRRDHSGNLAVSTSYNDLNYLLSGTEIEEFEKSETVGKIDF